MTFLADQAAGPKGCWIEFFGRPASAHKAIGLLALENQAPIVVSFARRLDRPLQFELSTYAVADPQTGGEPFASVKTLTQWFSSRLEEIIRAHPEQYWWLHRRWKDTRAERKAARKGGLNELPASSDPHFLPALLVACSGDDSWYHRIKTVGGRPARRGRTPGRTELWRSVWTRFTTKTASPA